MQAVTTIGLDIAKSVFQVHGIDAEGKVLIRRQLKRRYVLAFFQKLSPCLVGIEACATSHHWSRELKGLGHTVRLMPPAYVKPYFKRQKNDATDAEAICEAVTRANMRFRLPLVRCARVVVTPPETIPSKGSYVVRGDTHAVLIFRSTFSCDHRELCGHPSRGHYRVPSKALRLDDLPGERGGVQSALLQRKGVSVHEDLSRYGRPQANARRGHPSG
jgi:hypothetical protein